MYGKVFRQMYTGSMSRQAWEAIVTMQQFIVLADKNGEVDMTLEAISAETKIPLEILQKGVDVLTQPDRGSRTPNEDGRRLVLIDDRRDWGWRLVNYKKYAEIRSEEDRREYHRQYWHKRKLSGAKQDSTPLNTTQQTQQTVYTYTSESNSNGLSKKKSKRCPEDFVIPEEAIRSMQAECPNVDVPRETLRFRDHEFQRAKSDWLATWRNWMREAEVRAPKARKTKYEESMSKLKAAADRESSPVTAFLEGR